MTFHIIITLIVFFMVYTIISFDLINKASIVVLGASILLIFGILKPDEAFSKVNLHVIVLLTSLMILVNITKESGIFHYIAIKAAKMVHGDPLKLLILLPILTGVMSTFLDNVTTVIILSPIAILITVELGVSPVPYIIMMAIYSNIGGTATLIGDPPNIMIGYHANLTFGDFILNDGILIAIIGIISVPMTILLFRKKIKTTVERRARIMSFNEKSALTDRLMVVKTVLVWSYVIAGFLLQGIIHISPTIVAMSGAALFLVISGKKPEKFFAEIEWVTIFFFAGLFIIVGALENLGIIDFIGHKLIGISDGNITFTAFAILWSSGILSGFIDNIPYVAAMIPLVDIINHNIIVQGNNVLWWSLSAGACLGGNLTLIGASANVVSSEISKNSGYPIRFIDFTKYGVLYTLVSLIISTLYIYFRYLMN